MRAGRRFSRRQGHGGRACPAGPTDALPGGRTACPLRPRRQPWLDLICPPPPRAGVGLKTKVFVVGPLAAFAAVVFGFAVYNTVCKNAHVNLLNC